MYFGNFNGTSIISLFVLSSSNVLKAEWKIRNGEPLGAYPCISAVNKTLIYGKEFAVSGYQCAYKIPNTQEQDFQNYTVDLRNTKGMESFEISLVSSRAPEVPDIIGVSQRQNSIVMDWRSNFDGGAPQSFIVQYRKHEDDIWTAVHIQSNKNKNGFFILNPQPNTKYVLRMLASNRLGNSSFTAPYIFHTNDEKKTVWIQSKIWFLSLAVVCPVCLFVILWRFRQARKTVPNNSSRRNSYPNQGVVTGNDINESANRNDVYSSIDSRSQMLNKLQMNYMVTGISKGRPKSDNENINKRASRKRKNDSAKLNYIEIAFDPVTLKREFCIHGADNRTPYADIDFTAKADPMMSSDESEDSSSLNENNENDFVSLEDVQQWNIHIE